MENQLEKTNTEQLSLARMDDVMKFAVTLKKFIEHANLMVDIQGKKYVECDGWKFAGMNFGLTAIPTKPAKLSKEVDKIYLLYHKKKKWNNMKKVWEEYIGVGRATKDKSEADRLLIDEAFKCERMEVLDEYKYECECDIVHTLTGNKVGYGHAICTNLEPKKATFDEYAVGSTAQTRAIAKAYRNLIGFVVKAAGFEPLPAEEVDEKYQSKESEQSEQEIEFPVFDERVVEKLNKCADRIEIQAFVATVKHLHENPEFQSAAKKAMSKFPKTQNNNGKGNSKNTAKP